MGESPPTTPAAPAGAPTPSDTSLTALLRALANRSTPANPTAAPATPLATDGNAPPGTVAAMTITPDIIIRQDARHILRTSHPGTYTDVAAIAAPTPTTARHQWHTPTVDHKRRIAITPAVRTLQWAPGDTLRLEWHALDTFTLTPSAKDEPDTVLTHHVTIDTSNRIQLPPAAIANLGLEPGDRPLLGIPKDHTNTVTVIGPGAFERLTFGPAPTT